MSEVPLQCRNYTTKISQRLVREPTRVSRPQLRYPFHMYSSLLQGYLALEKLPPPGPIFFLGGGRFLMSEVPLWNLNTRIQIVRTDLGWARLERGDFSFV